MNTVRDSNDNFNMKMENIKLKNLIKTLEKENSKLPKAKKLLEEYKDVLKQKYTQVDELKEDNIYLYEYINKIPGFIRKIFVKEEIEFKEFKNE